MSTRNANSYIALNTSTSSSSSTFESSPSGLVSTDYDLEYAPLLPPIRGGKQHKGSLTILPDGRSYTYAYGPPGLAGLWYNGYALACAFFASIGGLEFGYDQGVIANVLVMEDFIRRWPITPLQKGILTAVLELGALFGALAAGLLADRYSRRHSIILACVIFTIGSSFQCFAQNLPHIFIGRAIGGVGIGALSMLTPLYMAEISPPEVRGSLMALEQLSIVVGVVLGFWIGFWTRNVPGAMSWRIPLGIQLIPGLILAVGTLFLPPSPRLMVLHGRHEDAEHSLTMLRGRNGAQGGLVKVELLEMQVETILVQRVDGDRTTKGVFDELRVWKRLFGKKYRDRTMVGVLIMVFQQWSGINALLYYGPTLVHSIGLRGDSITLLVSGGIGIVQLLAVLPAIVYIDRWGRKPLLRGGAAIMATAHLTIAMLVSTFEDEWADYPAAAWIAVGGIYVFTAAYGVSFGPIGWVLPSEVFPLSMRSRGVALSTASNWFNNFLIGLITPVAINFSASGTFMIFSTACFFAYLWSTYLVPETANVSLEEIDAIFTSSAGREDLEVKHQIEEELGLTALVKELGEE